jgi:hypothetical protein
MSRHANGNADVFALRTPSGGSVDRSGCCGATTCARGPARGGCLARRPLRSSEPENERPGAGLHSSRDGHKKDRRFSCCVTTRRRARQLARAGSADRPHGAVPAAHARQLHAVGGPPADFVASADAWRPATAATPVDTRGCRNSAGSTAEARRPHRTPCADKPAARTGDFWSTTSHREYAEDVPREVLSPQGAARGTRQKSLGHFFLPSPLDGYLHQLSRPRRRRGQAEGDTEGNQQLSLLSGRRRKETKGK